MICCSGSVESHPCRSSGSALVVSSRMKKRSLLASVLSFSVLPGPLAMNLAMTSQMSIQMDCDNISASLVSFLIWSKMKWSFVEMVLIESEGDISLNSLWFLICLMAVARFRNHLTRCSGCWIAEFIWQGHWVGFRWFSGLSWVYLFWDSGLLLGFEVVVVFPC